MTEENRDYEKIIKILRDSRPDLKRPGEFGDELMNRIRRMDRKTFSFSCFVESMFGWIYIQWVRRSLVGVAVLLVLVFIFQQAFIFKQVKDISKQIVIMGNGYSQFSASELDKRLTLYKISSRLSTGREIRISESQLKELLESYDDLQVRYKDIIRVIEEDPELKKYIEDKLIEIKNKKPDL